MSNEEKNGAYRVLARKYRPQSFDQLIGQDALVRTLTNAIQSGRIAHAFMLTGVRGVGKTTTARIIAKALNYTGPDGTSGPTAGPTDDCRICKAISEDRHPDIIEMDAASHTGVDDIREIIDGVRYAPAEARYKVYIIDEVHMLSKNAFNALLKTLEEPPPHVKFIFATTEIGKVPITILSRCQRFDLRRVDVETLTRHYEWVSAEENVEANGEAIAMIARAADGSVRDGLSMLDQAIALGDGKVTADLVQQMLGLADRTKLLDLYQYIMKGQTEPALAMMTDLYLTGVDPLSLVQDLLDITHLVSKFQAIKAPSITVEPNMTAQERDRATNLAQGLTMPSLGRVWQILLKGVSEVQFASNPQAAAEMIVIRLCYATDLPDPATLLKQLQDGSVVSAGSAPSRASSSGGSATVMTSVSSGASAQLKPVESPVQKTVAVANNNLATVQDLVALLEQNGEMILASHVYHYVELVKLEAGVIEFNPAPEAPPKLAQELGKKVSDITGQRWVGTIASNKPKQLTLAAQKEAAHAAELNEVKTNPLVKRVFDVFPGANIVSIKKKEN
jgi:DNA polymerase-3 subunit gamma/tau